MKFEDFIERFDSMDICRVKKWDELRLRGRYIRYQDAKDKDIELVGSKWLYAMEVPQKSHVVIGLH